MNKQQATDAVNKFCKLLFTDYPAAVEMMSDDFIWENFLPDHIPFGRSYEGTADMKTYINELAEAWEIGELVFHDYIYDPETRIMATPGVEKMVKHCPPDALAIWTLYGSFASLKKVKSVTYANTMTPIPLQIPLTGEKV